MKVLVIEDEIKIAEAIKSRLVKENYIIDKETDGLKGYYKACDNIYDLIILDIMLPNMNGFEILKNKVFYTIFLILVIIISLVMIPITIYYAYNQIELTNEFMKMHNELNTKYIIIITLSSIVFSLSLLYLTSKKGFYKNKDKLIVYILSNIVLTGFMTISSTYIANNYVLNNIKIENTLKDKVTLDKSNVITDTSINLNDNESENITLTLDKTTKIKLTKDTYITSLENEDSTNSNIDLNGYKLYKKFIKVPYGIFSYRKNYQIVV